MIKRILTIMCVTLLLLGCKSGKTVTGTAEIKRMSAKEVIRKHDKNKAAFKTLSAKLKVRYQDPTQSQNVTVSLRMEKDKKIWISASLLIPLAKVLITPDKISYYNKIDKTYFEGDFSLLSNWLGTELNFQQIQSALLGEALFDLSAEKHTAQVYDRSYLVQPKNQAALFERLFLVHPEHFKIQSQEVTQTQEGRILLMNYKSYQAIQNQTLPKLLHIVAVDKNEERTLDIQYRSISLNQDLNFPFKIPSHYQALEF